jgi:hypothetical protein
MLKAVDVKDLPKPVMMALWSEDRQSKNTRAVATDKESQVGTSTEKLKTIADEAYPALRLGLNKNQ